MSAQMRFVKVLRYASFVLLIFGGLAVAVIRSYWDALRDPA